MQAYLGSSLFSGLVTPTGGALLAMLAVAGVPYGRWLRFILVPMLLLSVLTVLGVIAGVMLRVQ